MSMQLRSELRAMWETVAQDPKDGLSTGRISVQLGDRHVLVGVDERGAQHLLLPVRSGPDSRRLWKGSAICADRRNLRGWEMQVKTWLDIHCRRSELSAIFVLLAATVVESLQHCSTELIEENCIKILDEWRALFGGVAASEASIIGLIGELLVLEKLASRSSEKAISSWAGPHGGRHDFRLRDMAIEVKTTTRRAGSCAHINGVLQLLEPKGGRLAVAFLKLEKVADGPESISKIVKRLESLAVPVNDLREILSDLGVDDLNSDSASMCFSLLGESWFQLPHAHNIMVTGDDPYGVTKQEFPRIVPETFRDGALPQGVLDLNYEIDLAGVPSMTGRETFTFLSQFLGESA